MEHMNLSGICAVVTGASSGLGLAMSESLLRAGASVALASRPSDKLDVLVNNAGIGMRTVNPHFLVEP